ncbi:MAG: hypothetical protein KC635_26845 [Myxococcales bacterium]|nr:hypothetical protein [Myxococcales bacterium]MCB9735512.1 hypothetical protein [Deltaproteobacteria bacterium]
MSVFALAFQFVVAASLASGAPSAPEPLPAAVNAVWGDTSWELRYGRPPTAADAPAERVRVHLEEVLVRLREVDTSGLDAARRARREAALDALAAYVAGGAFPENVDTSFARSEFIDHDGRRCAVGAMVEATAGTDAAERLDALYNRDSVWAMDGPGSEVTAWAEAYGFTQAELAFIQPAYPPEWNQPRYHHDTLVGARLGVVAYGEADYENGFEGLDARPDPALELAGYWLWQPGAHWGFGPVLGVISNVEDFYEDDSAALTVGAHVEWAAPFDGSSPIGFVFFVEGGGMFLPASPGSFAGVMVTGGAGLTWDLISLLALRLDGRVQHYQLWGDHEQETSGLQVLVTAGVEFRFDL